MNYPSVKRKSVLSSGGRLGIGRAAVFIGAFLLAWTPPALGDDVKRLALLVGANVGSGDDIELKYAEKDADRLAGVLRELGEFERIDIIKRPTAKMLGDKLREFKQQISTWKKQGARVFLMFFYSGHADDATLHLGETAMTSDDLLDRISHSGADLRVAIIDACQSGAMIRDKGLVVKKPIKVKLQNDLDVTGQAVFASTSRGESAQESESLKGSFFSSYLVTGLRGAADANRDGAVSLVEAYGYAGDRTVQGTVVSSAGMQHPMYEMQIKGKKEVFLTWPAKGSSLLRFRADTAGHFLVINEKGDTIMAEVDAEPRSESRLALPNGKYTVKKRATKGVLVSTVVLPKGGELLLAEANMKLTPYIQVADKGSFNEFHGPTSRGNSGNRPKRVWTWIAGAGTLAALGAGLTLEVLAKQSRDQRDDLLEKNRNWVESEYYSDGDKNNDDSTTYSEVRDLDDKAKRRAIIGNVCLGVGGALAATTVLLYYLEGIAASVESPKAHASQITAAPAIGPSQLGITIQGRF